MIIKVDKEGDQVMGQLLDIYLKTNWINALDSVNKVRNSIEIIEEDILNTKK